MKRAKGVVLVLVTVPSISVARRLAKAACAARLVACVNIVPGLESHYWWEGKLEKAREVLLIYKARTSTLGDLEELILRDHPYETPEILVLPPSAGSEAYLKWWAREARDR